VTTKLQFIIIIIIIIIAQIKIARSPWRLNCVRCRLIPLGPQHGTCFMSLVWHLEILMWGLLFLRKSVRPGVSYVHVAFKNEKKFFNYMCHALQIIFRRVSSTAKIDY